MAGGGIPGLGTRNRSITTVLLFQVFLMRHKDIKSPGGPGPTRGLMRLQGKLSCVCFPERCVGVGVGGLERMQPIQAELEPDIEETMGSMDF